MANFDELAMLAAIETVEEAEIASEQSRHRIHYRMDAFELNDTQFRKMYRLPKAVMNDPYEKELKRLRDIYDALTSDESEEDDPFADSAGEYGSDQDYVPSDSSTAESDRSEMSCSDELTSPNPKAAKRLKSKMMQQGTSVDTDGSQINIAIQNIEKSKPGSQKELDEEVEQHILEQDGLKESIAQQGSDEDNLDWEDTITDIPEFNFDESTNGLKINIDPNATPTDVFERLFTKDILQFLVDCTNHYRKVLTTTNRPKTKYARDAYYRDVTLDEMKKFFALCLLQGQISTSNMRRFFSYTDVLYFHPIFSFVMSGRRFEQILRVLYCASTFSKRKEKVQPFLDMLIAQYQSVYGPTKELSLDESLLHFRGRLAFRVYMKNKKAKYGIKFYELTTSDGYLLNTEMYSGTIEKENQESTKLESVVLRLMKPFLMKGHELFMDNFYNSYQLSEKLLTRKTHTTGTLRSNRKGNPRELVNRKLKKGDHFWCRRKQVYVSKWRDKRDVLVITTRNHPRLITTKNRYGKEMIKPEEIVAYNRHMSGIDRCDQMTSTYSTMRKTIRWYKKLQPNIEGRYLIRRHKHDNRRQENILQETAPTTNQISSEGHWPEKIPGHPSAKSNKKKIFLKCRMCTKNGLRRETAYRFYMKFGFPGIIGCIDCTHVAIISPHQQHPDYPEHLYINRKHYHSINVQLHRVLHYGPETASQIINACAVLHNICIANNVEEPELGEGDEHIDFGLLVNTVAYREESQTQNRRHI
nr:unnamed protein product [Callosobruchus analis]